MRDADYDITAPPVRHHSTPHPKAAGRQKTKHAIHGPTKKQHNSIISMYWTTHLPLRQLHSFRSSPLLPKDPGLQHTTAKGTQPGKKMKRLRGPPRREIMQMPPPWNKHSTQRLNHAASRNVTPGPPRLQRNLYQTDRRGHGHGGGGLS